MYYFHIVSLVKIIQVGLPPCFVHAQIALEREGLDSVALSEDILGTDKEKRKKT